MKKFSIIFSVMLMLAVALPASAYTITTLYSSAPNAPDGNTGYTSPYASVAVETFDGSPFSQSWSWDGNGQLVTGSVTGEYAAPFGQGYDDNTRYLSVPSSFATAPVVTATGFGVANYLGLWWGSMDDYNTFEFYNQGNKILTFTGLDVITQGAASGDQVSLGSNHYVNFIGLPNFDEIRFSSTQYAFEVDNVAIGTLPEPTTMLLFGLGLVGLAGVRRFKK
jgi:hypothetical protein